MTTFTLLPTAPMLEKLPTGIEITLLELPILSRLDRLSLRAACEGTGGFYFIPPFEPNELFELEKDESLETRGWPRHPLGCSVCQRLRPRTKFTDRAVRSNDRGRGREHASRRICIDCGVKPDHAGHQVYVKGTYLKILNDVHVVCAQCNQVRLAGDKRRGLCPQCIPVAREAAATKGRKEAAKRQAAAAEKPTSFGIYNGKMIDRKILKQMPASVKARARKEAKRFQESMRAKEMPQDLPLAAKFAAYMQIADVPTASAQSGDRKKGEGVEGKGAEAHYAKKGEM